ncbi:MAG: TetR family transcriptional regulator C-terminal domain-containing protein [Rhizobiales bacterium]|nr:TetR family transcriptional regulator C-terminal domain-containing protein [Hyphomicrobiales bacterium]NRB15558.1 TetR family transcriptional regulator C-terminal domain-containing protein [Hyphomicrobiales bacterium]
MDGAGARARSPHQAHKKTVPKTRIQRKKTEQILSAALDIFSAYGFRGSTIDQIATQAGMSKPNILYYFQSKEAIHAQLLERLLKAWLEPLEQIDKDGEPVAEIIAYMQRKLQMSEDFPRESRLFANEILQGVPRINSLISGGLKTLVDEKTALIKSWSEAGKIADIDPHHLLFSIWATTQHYADFDAQIRTLMGKNNVQRYKDAAIYLENLFKSMLKP